VTYDTGFFSIFLLFFKTLFFTFNFFNFFLLFGTFFALFLGTGLKTSLVRCDWIDTKLLEDRLPAAQLTKMDGTGATKVEGIASKAASTSTLYTSSGSFI